MPLVTRNHPKLTLEGARAVLAAAQRRAEEIRVPMNIAVVDEGGHLLVFERMDGAKLVVHRHFAGEGAGRGGAARAHGAGHERRPSESAAFAGAGHRELRRSRRPFAAACRSSWMDKWSAPSA